MCSAAGILEREKARREMIKKQLLQEMEEGRHPYAQDAIKLAIGRIQLESSKDTNEVLDFYEKIHEIYGNVDFIRFKQSLDICTRGLKKYQTIATLCSFIDEWVT